MPLIATSHQLLKCPRGCGFLYLILICNLYFCSARVKDAKVFFIFKICRSSEEPWRGCGVFIVTMPQLSLFRLFVSLKCVSRGEGAFFPNKTDSLLLLSWLSAVDPLRTARPGCGPRRSVCRCCCVCLHLVFLSNSYQHSAPITRSYKFLWRGHSPGVRDRLVSFCLVEGQGHRELLGEIF